MRFGDSRANSTRGVGGLQEVRSASRSVSLRTRWPPALPGCGVGMAERIHAGLRKMHLLLVVLLAPASQGAPGVCVEDVPDGLPMTCTAMDAATPALSCSTLYRMGYQCCPQCGPCGEHGSLCSSGSSGAFFFCITLLFLIVVWGFVIVVDRLIVGRVAVVDSGRSVVVALLVGDWEYRLV